MKRAGEKTKEGERGARERRKSRSFPMGRLPRAVRRHLVEFKSQPSSAARAGGGGPSRAWVGGRPRTSGAGAFVCKQSGALRRRGPYRLRFLIDARVQAPCSGWAAETLRSALRLQLRPVSIARHPLAHFGTLPLMTFNGEAPISLSPRTGLPIALARFWMDQWFCT